MPASPDQIAQDLKRFVAESYPAMEIRAQPWRRDPSRMAIYFIEEKFALIYPQQRYHYLVHLIPQEYHKAHLENTVWFELAPGEDPESLRYPDEELIREITPDVMRCLKGSGFFRDLDDALCPESSEHERQKCWGDYRHSKPILLRRGFTDDEFFEIFHVLMGQGGFCDCEILYNVVESNRLKAECWTARAEGRTPYYPHTDG